MDKKWSEKTTFEKTVRIISFIAFCVWIVFEILERTNKSEATAMGSYISVCVICIAEAMSFWNFKRSVSYIGIAGAVCMLAVIVLTLM
jgi:hypothetical protein